MEEQDQLSGIYRIRDNMANFKLKIRIRKSTASTAGSSTSAGQTGNLLKKNPYFLGLKKKTFT